MVCKRKVKKQIGKCHQGVLHVGEIYIKVHDLYLRPRAENSSAEARGSNQAKLSEREQEPILVSR